MCDIQIPMDSSKKDLQMHAQSQKHIQNCEKEVYQQNTCVMPLGDSAVEVYHINITDSASISKHGLPNDHVFLSNAEIKNDESNELAKKNRYSQKYRQAWEGDPLFNKWLTSSNKGSCYAFCKVCDIQLALSAGKKDLQNHAKTRKHIKNCGKTCQLLPNSNSSVNGHSEQVKSKKVEDHLLACAGAESKNEHDLYLSQTNRLEIASNIDNFYLDSEERILISKHRQMSQSNTGMQWTKAMITKPAPHWEAMAVINEEFKELKLTDFRGKYLVFFIYPLDFTFPTEILAFNDRLSDFHSLGSEVIACSIDSHFTHLAWIKTPKQQGGLGSLNITLLSDITHSIAKDYGVYLEDQGIAVRGLFIIDDKGILRQISMNDLPVGRSVDETLRLVQALQYTDKHGVMCPAGWKPGDDTIIPNPEDCIKYFKNR